MKDKIFYLTTKGHLICIPTMGDWDEKGWDRSVQISRPTAKKLLRNYRLDFTLNKNEIWVRFGYKFSEAAWITNEKNLENYSYDKPIILFFNL